VMSARGKLRDRNWKRSDGSPATIDDISVFVIPILPYKEEYLHQKESGEGMTDHFENGVDAMEPEDGVEEENGDCIVDENGVDSMEEEVSKSEEPVTCDSDSADNGRIVSEDQLVLEDKINPEDKVEIKVLDEVTDMSAQ